MAERRETRHSIPSYGYSFFVDNESGYAFKATLTFEPQWWNYAPGFSIEVLDPKGKIIYKENLESVNYADETVFHGYAYGPPDASPPEPLRYPEGGRIFPTGESNPISVDIDIPATDSGGGVYQIRIVTHYTSINSEARMSTVELLLDPPLPYGWKGDMGFTDLCKKDDTGPKTGTVYFCSLSPGMLGRNGNEGLKQWLQARNIHGTRKGFRVKFFKDEPDGSGVLLKEVLMQPVEDADGERRRSWRVHTTNSDEPMLTLDYSIAGPDHLRNDKQREVYRIEWENIDPEPDESNHANALLLETHESTEVTEEFTSDFKDFQNYSRQGRSDVPLILCNDRNTAIRLNNGISYIEDDGLDVSNWDTNRIVFLNANQEQAWMKLKKARESYRDNIVAFNKVNTDEDPYWIGRPVDVANNNMGSVWDYAASMNQVIKENIENDWNPDDPTDDPERSSYWGEDKLNRLSNFLLYRGTYEYLPCHIFEQNMDPSSPWFGVFWNWHSNVHEDIAIDGDHRDVNGDLKSLGNPYSTVFRYLYDPDGNIYSNWKDQKFPRLGPFTSNLGALLAKYYSLGSQPIGDEECLQGDGYQPLMGLGFLRDANPFYKNVGIRNRLVLALLHQLMTTDQNGDNIYFNDDYRGGANAFATNGIIPLLDVVPDIGTHPDDIFQGEEAEEVKDIIKTGVMHTLERYAGVGQCSAHNQWLHAWIALAKGAACLNDSSVDYLFLLNLKKSDNRYNHGVPTWQESGGYDNIYCAFAVYSCAKVRSYLLQRRFNIVEENHRTGTENSTDPILKNIELCLREFESQLNDLTDYWNHTIAMEPDGSITGACDMNSRVDGASWATSPRRFLEFIGKPYGSTLEIPEMDACQTLAAWTTGRQYETWNDMVRKWQHNVPDPYGVSYDFDVSTGDGASIEDKRLFILGKLKTPESDAYDRQRFRKDFPKDGNGDYQGLGGGICPKVPRDRPRAAGMSWMDVDDNTVNGGGRKYAISGVHEDDLSDTIPDPLPAHRNRSFIKLWPSFHQYWNNSQDNLRVYTNQNNVFADADSRPNIGGISVKTDNYYCHIHADGWNPSNQKSDWNKRRNEDHDPEYMWALTAFGGGISLLTTPENGAVFVGKRKGFIASNQIFLKRYTKDDDSDIGPLASIWNALVEQDGCGYAWACPDANNAVAEWDPDGSRPSSLGIFTHKQTFNYNFSKNQESMGIGHNKGSFDELAQEGIVGWIERKYEFFGNRIDVDVKMMPFFTVNWDEVYMTLPISLMGRGYYSGDAQYALNADSRRLTNRANIGTSEYGDRFEVEKGESWKREVFIGADKVTIGHRHFHPDGTEIRVTTPGVFDRIERLVSGPGTDPLYPQQGDSPIQNGNFLWPPTQELLDKHLQMKSKGETPEALLEYCRGGKNQGDRHPDLPLGWTVPAPSGYHDKEGPGKETDDGLKLQFSSSIRNWQAGVPKEFSFSIIPGKSMNDAEQGN